jgi:hypothetical protein
LIQTSVPAPLTTQKFAKSMENKRIRFLIEEKNDGSLYYITCFCDQLLAMLFTFEIKTIDQEGPRCHNWVKTIKKAPCTLSN